MNVCGICDEQLRFIGSSTGWHGNVHVLSIENCLVYKSLRCCACLGKSKGRVCCPIIQSCILRNSSTCRESNISLTKEKEKKEKKQQNVHVLHRHGSINQHVAIRYEITLLCMVYNSQIYNFGGGTFTPRRRTYLKEEAKKCLWM